MSVGLSDLLLRFALRAALRCFARSCQQVVQSRVLFENVLGMKMLLLLVGLSGSEASNTCSNMHTIPFSPTWTMHIVGIQEFLVQDRKRTV